MADGSKITMTQEAFDRLQADLHRLTTIDRPAALSDLEDALTDSVNVGESGTHLAAVAAKEHLDVRIAELRSRVARAVVVTGGADDEVSVGSVVTIDHGDGATMQMIVDHSSNETMLAVSPASPLGTALIGRRVGDVVTWTAPSGELSATVVSIGVD